MPDPPKPNLESVRDWLQTLTIMTGLIAGIWGGYTAFQRWSAERAAALVPRANLAMDVDIKERSLGTTHNSGQSDEQLEAIEVTVTVKNTRPYIVYRMKNGWSAWGISAGHQTGGGENDWVKDANDLIADRIAGGFGKFFVALNSTFIGAGTVFSDEFLYSDETTSSSFRLYVPRGLFEAVGISVMVPSTKSKSLGANLTVKEDGNLDIRFYWERPDGSRKDIYDREFEAASFNSDLALQATSAYRELSLSREAPSPPAPAGSPETSSR